MSNERVAYVDIAKTIAIFLVILGHVTETDTFCKTVVYSFHMPLFFILAGFFLDTSGTISINKIWHFVKKKFMALMVPYFIWAFFYSQLNIKNLAYIGWGSWQTLGKAQSLSSLWFLPCLFLGYLIAYWSLLVFNFIKDSNWRNTICGIILFIIAFLVPHNLEIGVFWCADIAIMAASFICWGRPIRLIVERISVRQPVEIFLMIISASVLFCFSLYSFKIGNHYVRMANGTYGNALVFLTSSLFGSFAVIELSRLLSAYLPNSCSLISFAGGNTLAVFVIHRFILNSLFVFIEYESRFTFVLTSSIIIYIISLLCAWLILKVAPVMFGKYYQSK